MEKFINFAWLIATTTSWISFAVASWFWADDSFDRGLAILTILWFVMSIVLFVIGYKMRNQQNK